MSRRPGGKASQVVYALDDDGAFTALLAQVLRRFGLACETFSQSAALLARAKAKLPALCLLDLNVEGVGSSIELVRSLRTACPPELPIIITSGDSERGTIAHALESGANDYLLKPLEREVLISKLMRYLTSSELEQAAMNFVTATEMDWKVQVDTDVELLEIDELGVRISSKHLLSKGAVVQISGAVFKELIGEDRPVLVTVDSTWVDPLRDCYDSYATFDLSDQTLSQKLRTWLGRMTQKTG